MNNSNLLDGSTISARGLFDHGTCDAHPGMPSKNESAPYAHTFGLGRVAANVTSTPAAHGCGSTSRGAAGNAAPVDGGAHTLFEGRLPVATHVGQRASGTQTLGFCVRAAAVGAGSAATRKVLFRLTDPDDPFLLFQLELMEEDYGALKQKLELLVDFNGFPRYVVGMLDTIVSGEAKSSLQATFTVQAQNAGVGTFRVIETTSFKTVEHLSLTLVREGDAGQKHYLAEQFLYFQQAYNRCHAERLEESSQAHNVMEELRAENTQLLEDMRRLREALKLSKSESEKTSLAHVTELQESHRHELEQVRRAYENNLKDAERRVTKLQDELGEVRQSKETTVEDMRTKLANLESANAALSSKLRLAEDKSRLQEDELTQLREAVEDLRLYKTETIAAMKENEINYVSVTERLRGALSALTSREEEVASLREDNQKQDRYIQSLSAQNDRLVRQAETGDGNLSKAHHIIANQLHTIKGAKERYVIAADQIRSQQALLNERDLTVQRLKDELAAATDRVQSLQAKNAELREQLQQTDDAREKLVQELKNSQAALLHLQRSTTVHGRHWGVMSSPSVTPGSYGASTGFYSAAAPVAPATTSGTVPMRGTPSGMQDPVAGDMGYGAFRSRLGGPTHHEDALGKPGPAQSPTASPAFGGERGASVGVSPSPTRQSEGGVSVEGGRMKSTSPAQRSSAGLTGTTRTSSASQPRESLSSQQPYDAEGRFAEVKVAASPGAHYASKSFFPSPQPQESAPAPDRVKASAYF